MLHATGVQSPDPQQNGEQESDHMFKGFTVCGIRQIAH